MWPVAIATTTWLSTLNLRFPFSLSHTLYSIVDDMSCDRNCMKERTGLILLALARKTSLGTASRISPHVIKIVSSTAMMTLLPHNYITDDDNRVVLQPSEGHEHDFINASYVDVSIYSSITYHASVYVMYNNYNHLMVGI